MSLIVVEFRFTMTANGSRLCEVADFLRKCSIEKLNLNSVLNCHRSTESAILQNRCCAFVLLYSTFVNSTGSSWVKITLVTFPFSFTKSAIVLTRCISGKKNLVSVKAINIKYEPVPLERSP